MCKWSPNFTCKKEEKKANEQSGPEKKIPLLLPLRSYSAISPKNCNFSRILRALCTLVT